jgi:hypothetical protein
MGVPGRIDAQEGGDHMGAASRIWNRSGLRAKAFRWAADTVGESTLSGRSLCACLAERSRHTQGDLSLSYHPSPKEHKGAECSTCKCSSTASKPPGAEISEGEHSQTHAHQRRHGRGRRHAYRTQTTALETHTLDKQTPGHRGKL